MAVVRTTTYRGRDYQRVVHEDVALPLDKHAPRYRFPHLNTLWQKNFRLHTSVGALGLAHYEKQVLGRCE